MKSFEQRAAMGTAVEGEGGNAGEVGLEVTKHRGKEITEEAGEKSSKFQ
jgi:hypothetical protein